ncbi:MAG: hypothetical protein ABEK01_05635 [Candidatus Nanohaloarchaea archaeon]
MRNLELSSISTQRLYGGSIAVISGIYSIYVATFGVTGSMAVMWLMFILGLITSVHGALILTGYTGMIDPYSGPLMMAYSVFMAVNQIVSWISRGSISQGMMALAVMMAFSGAIMTVREEEMEPGKD